jgi:hypothetical protein
VPSDDGSFYAEVERKVCKDKADSDGTVILSSNASSERLRVVTFRPVTSDISISWKFGKLVVTVDFGTQLKTFDNVAGWPAVQVDKR